MSEYKLRVILERFGLSTNESKVYLTLLELGNAMAGKIAKQAMIDRTSCYDALKRLLQKGLVVYALEANKKMFKSVNPARLLSILKDKEEEIMEILPQLSLKYEKEKEECNVTVYKGYRGIKSVFEDILKNAKENENLVIDSSGAFTERMPYFAEHFIRSVEKNKIKIRHITRRNLDIHPSKTTSVRYFSKKTKETTITTNIYDNKIAIIIWASIPEAIIIENKGATESYKDYFEVLWNSTDKSK